MANLRKDFASMRSSREIKEAIVKQGVLAVMTILLGGIGTAVMFFITGAGMLEVDLAQGTVRTPTSVAWSLIVVETAVKYPVVVARRRDGEIIKDIRTATLGPGSNELCAKIPAELDTVRDLVIRGQVNYAVPHGFWTIWQDLPLISVPQP
jgi:hypothetical protein